MLIFDGIRPSPELREAIPGASHLLISAAPGDAGDPVLAALGDDIARLRNCNRSSICPRSASMATTAAPGSTRPRRPFRRTRAARRAIDAELAWQALGRQCRTPVAILRLGGIYGPGQNAFVRLLAGRAHRIDKPGHVSNRIHVADIAQAIDAAFARRFDGIVNVTDGEPAPPGDQIEFAAKLLGIAPPPLLSLDEAKRTLSPFLMSFYDGCARVRNDKLKNALGVTLRYPDYRAGLQALLDDGFAAPPEI